MCTNRLRNSIFICLVDQGCSEKYGYVQQEVATFPSQIRTARQTLVQILLRDQVPISSTHLTFKSGQNVSTSGESAFCNRPRELHPRDVVPNLLFCAVVHITMLHHHLNSKHLYILTSYFYRPWSTLAKWWLQSPPGRCRLSVSNHSKKAVARKASEVKWRKVHWRESFVQTVF